MKKLRLYDHLGQKVKEFDVYVEGQSFTWRSPQPEAIWLGTITLQDVDEEEVVAQEAIISAEEAVEKMVREEEKVEEKVVTEPEPIPDIDKEKEVKSELEKPDDTSAGDSGSGEASELEKPEDTPESLPTRTAAKGDKGHRKSKSPKSAVGSRARKHTSTGSRGKTEGATVEEVS